jgi:hypothetical protein
MCLYFGASIGFKWYVKYFNQAKCLPKIYFMLCPYVVQNKGPSYKQLPLPEDQHRHPGGGGELHSLGTSGLDTF